MRIREINYKAHLWTIPRERMKTPNDHEVPLCDCAIAILKAVIPKEAEPTDLVFNGPNPSMPLGMNAVLDVLKVVHPTITTHRCRASFRDWPGDKTSFPREVAEMALAHAVGNDVECVLQALLARQFGVRTGRMGPVSHRDIDRQTQSDLLPEASRTSF